jgi:hypothetical protein
LKTGLKYILLILLFGTSQCQKIDPGETVSIPDPNFLNELFNEGVDSNGDGQISTQEAELIRALSLGPSGISDLTGIEAFVNLDTLVVEVNPLIPPDLSKNKALIYLTLKGCGLTQLDISKNAALKYLDCTGNEGLDSFLETIDLSGNPELESLFLLGNELIALDVTHNPQMKKIECSRNRISELDLSANLLLGDLKCKNNLLKSLDLSVNTALVVMACCGNQLSSINLSQNTKLVAIGIDNMTSLREVCVWTIPFPSEGIKVLMSFSPNAFFTTECSN